MYETYEYIYIYIADRKTTHTTHTHTHTHTHLVEQRAQQSPHPVSQACVEVVEDHLRFVGSEFARLVHLRVQDGVAELEVGCECV
jgi:hypothetical protein